MKRFYVCLWAVMMLCVTSHGAPVDEGTALSLAKRFWSGGPAGSLQAPADLRLERVPEARLQEAVRSYRDHAFYVFNRTDAPGFVIVSGDDSMRPVLGYSRTNAWTGEMPDALKAYLEAYAEQVEQMRARKTPAYPGVEQSYPEVAPLLTCSWNQSAPFNGKCPVDYTTGEVSVTGCVATAFAQIMYFHRWPVQGSGTHTYESERCGTLTQDFSESVYQWDKMLDAYVSGNYDSEQADAVALLMRDAGISVNMDYSSIASGAYSFLVAQALAEHFGYSTEKMAYHDRECYTTPEWMELLASELQAGRPMLYSGASLTSGHAFVCDGMASDGYLHINWGWGGYYDGYFDMNVLSPQGVGIGGGSGRYSFGQSVVAGIEPARTSSGRPALKRMELLTGIYPTGECMRTQLDIVAYGVFNASSVSFRNLEFGLALCQEGVQKKIVATETVADEWPVGDAYNLAFSSFALTEEDCPDGEFYSLRLLFRQQGETEWTPCHGYRSGLYELFIKIVEGQVEFYTPSHNLSTKITSSMSRTAVVAGEETTLELTVDTEGTYSPELNLFAMVGSPDDGFYHIAEDSVMVKFYDSSRLHVSVPVETVEGMSPGIWKVYLLKKSAEGDYSYFRTSEMAEIDLIAPDQTSDLYTQNFSAGMDWSAYDRDGLTPNDDMKGIGFAVGTAWANARLGETPVVISHSSYDPSGYSDDWMVSPALEIPATSRYVEFSWVSAATSNSNDYRLYVTTEGDQPDDFLNNGRLLATFDSDEAYYWIFRSVDLSDYRGKSIRLAFVNVGKDAGWMALTNLCLQSKGEISTLPGDVNSNGVLDADDVGRIVNQIIGYTAVARVFWPHLADFNADGAIDIADVQGIQARINGWQTPTDETVRMGKWMLEDGVLSMQSVVTIGAFYAQFRSDTYRWADWLTQVDGLNGVAYRKADGHVAIAAWSEQETLSVPTFQPIFTDLSGELDELKAVDLYGREIILVEDPVASAIRPNEVETLFRLEGNVLTAAEGAMLRLFDTTGRLVGQSCTGRLCLPAGSRGTYLLEVGTADDTRVCKFVR